MDSLLIACNARAALRNRRVTVAGLNATDSGHGGLLTKDEIRQYVKNVETMNARMKELVRTGVPVEEAGKRLKLDDLGWARSASTQTFLAGSIPGYYAEMKAVIEKERKLGAIR